MSEEQSIEKEQAVASRKFLLSQTSRRYSERVLTEIGKEIAEAFPNINFFLLGRYKGEESFLNKIKACFENKKSKNFYDNIGYRIVVKYVPKEVKFKGYTLDEIINGNCDEKLKSIYQDFINANSVITKYVKELNVQDLQKRNGKKITEEDLENDKKEFLEAMHEPNNYKTDLVSYIILNHLLENSENLKMLGIEAVSGRKKCVNGGETGWYFAMHNTIKSGYLDGYFAEMQSTSYWKYKLSLSKGAHNLMEDKEIKIPDIMPPTVQLENCTEKDYNALVKFANAMQLKMPEHLIFQREGKKQPARVYKCSVLENYFIQYNEVTVHATELEKERFRNTLKYLEAAANYQQYIEQNNDISKKEGNSREDNFTRNFSTIKVNSKKDNTAQLIKTFNTEIQEQTASL